jgi:hypothetical protein
MANSRAERLASELASACEAAQAAQAAWQQAEQAAGAAQQHLDQQRRNGQVCAPALVQRCGTRSCSPAAPHAATHSPPHWLAGQPAGLPACYSPVASAPIHLPCCSAASPLHKLELIPTRPPHPLPPPSTPPQARTRPAPPQRTVEECAMLRKALEEASRRLHALTSDTTAMVDRRIVVKLMVTYFERNHSKEVLQLMVRAPGDVPVTCIAASKAPCPPPCLQPLSPEPPPPLLAVPAGQDAGLWRGGGAAHRQRPGQPGAAAQRDVHAVRPGQGGAVAGGQGGLGTHWRAASPETGQHLRRPVGGHWAAGRLDAWSECTRWPPGGHAPAGRLAAEQGPRVSRQPSSGGCIRRRLPLAGSCRRLP